MIQTKLLIEKRQIQEKPLLQNRKNPFLKKTISEAIFKELLTSVECQEWDLNGSIGFDSEIGNFHFSVNGESRTYFETINVDAFGFYDTLENWVTCEPSLNQLSAMKKIITDKADELHAEKSDHEDNCLSDWDAILTDSYNY